MYAASRKQSIVAFILYVKSGDVVKLVVGYGVEFVFTRSVMGILVILSVTGALILGILFGLEIAV